MRQHKPVDDNAHMFSLEEWDQAIDDGRVASDDGSGFWVNDGFYLNDDYLDDNVFGFVPEGATHVAWFNERRE